MTSAKRILAKVTYESPTAWRSTWWKEFSALVRRDRSTSYGNSGG